MQTAAQDAPITASPRTVQLYSLNTYWPGKGGLFRGIIPGKDGAPDRLLFEHTEAFPKADWQTQMDAAAALVVDDHNDFQLPDEVEAALIYGVAKADHAPNWHWLRSQAASGPAYAWSQSFSYGDQNYDWKNFNRRARAVRSEPIQ